MTPTKTLQPPSYIINVRSLKLLTSTLIVMLQTFFRAKRTHREIVYSKGTTRVLRGHFRVTPRALQGHLGTLVLEGNLGILALKALGHLSTCGTRALKGHLGIQVLGY